MIRCSKCGNDVEYTVNELCSSCMSKKIFEENEHGSEYTVKLNQEERTIIPFFINARYENRIKAIRNFVYKGYDTMEIIKTGIEKERDDKKYIGYNLEVKKGFMDNDFNYVLALLSDSKARCYDFVYTSSEKPESLTIVKKLSNVNIENIHLLYARYKNEFYKITKNKSNVNSIPIVFNNEQLRQVSRMEFDEVRTYIKNKFNIVKTDGEFAYIPVGRPTFNKNIIFITDIFEKIILLSTTLNSENIKQYTSPAIFLKKVINDDVLLNFIQSRNALVDNSNFDYESYLSNNFDYDSSDSYEEGEDGDYDEDDDEY